MLKFNDSCFQQQKQMNIEKQQKFKFTKHQTIDDPLLNKDQEQDAKQPKWFNEELREQFQTQKSLQYKIIQLYQHIQRKTISNMERKKSNEIIQAQIKVYSNIVDQIAKKMNNKINTPSDNDSNQAFLKNNNNVYYNMKTNKGCSIYGTNTNNYSLIRAEIQEKQRSQTKSIKQSYTTQKNPKQKMLVISSELELKQSQKQQIDSIYRQYQEYRSRRLNQQQREQKNYTFHQEQQLAQSSNQNQFTQRLTNQQIESQSGTQSQTNIPPTQAHDGANNRRGNDYITSNIYDQMNQSKTGSDGKIADYYINEDENKLNDRMYKWNYNYTSKEINQKNYKNLNIDNAEEQDHGKNHRNMKYRQQCTPISPKINSKQHQNQSKPKWNIQKRQCLEQKYFNENQKQRNNVNRQTQQQENQSQFIDEQVLNRNKYVQIPSLNIRARKIMKSPNFYKQNNVNNFTPKYIQLNMGSQIGKNQCRVPDKEIQFQQYGEHIKRNIQKKHNLSEKAQCNIQNTSTTSTNRVTDRKTISRNNSQFIHSRSPTTLTTPVGTNYSSPMPSVRNFYSNKNSYQNLDQPYTKRTYQRHIQNNFAQLITKQRQISPRPSIDVAISLSTQNPKKVLKNIVNPNKSFLKRNYNNNSENSQFYSHKYSDFNIQNLWNSPDAYPKKKPNIVKKIQPYLLNKNYSGSHLINNQIEYKY